MQSLRLPCLLLFSCYHGSLATGNRLVSCYLYPSYLCYKDVEGASTSSSSSATAELTAKYEKMRLWSIYWIVVAAWTALERLTDATCFWYARNSHVMR